jgi:nicotinate-nucleotide adenylyltransferase
MDEQPGTGRRVAFFGGSFDPPHLGHLAVARAARAALGLDTVVFAPVGAQPLKPLGSTASFGDRVAMTELAIAEDAGFRVSLADAPKLTGEPNYTLETLLGLQKELPAGSALFCLMGADSFAGLKRWHRGAEIPFAASLVVASRPGERLDDLRSALPEGLAIEAARGPEESAPGVEMRSYLLHNPQGQTAPFYVLPGLEVEISASEIRRLAGIRRQGGIRERAGEIPGTMSKGRERLPEAVSEYIRVHGLYR